MCGLGTRAVVRIPRASRCPDIFHFGVSPFRARKRKKERVQEKEKERERGGENRFDDDEVRRDGPWQLSLCPLVAIENNMRIRSDEDGGGDGGRSSDREVKFIRPGWRSVGSGSSLSRRLLSFSRLILRSRLSAVG